MHVIPFTWDLYDAYFLHQFFCKQDIDHLVCSFHAGTFANAYQQVMGTYHHYVTTFEGYFFFFAIAGHKEMTAGIGQLNDIVPAGRKKRMVIKNIFCKQRFAYPGLFRRLVQQDMIFDHNADIPGKNEIRDRGEDHGFVGQAAGDEYFG